MIYITNPLTILYVLLFALIVFLQIRCLKNKPKWLWWVLHGIEILGCIAAFALALFCAKNDAAIQEPVSLIAAAVFGASAFITMGFEIWNEIRMRNAEG